MNNYLNLRAYQNEKQFPLCLLIAFINFIAFLIRRLPVKIIAFSSENSGKPSDFNYTIF